MDLKDSIPLREDVWPQSAAAASGKTQNLPRRGSSALLSGFGSGSLSDADGPLADLVRGLCICLLIWGPVLLGVWLIGLVR